MKLFYKQLGVCLLFVCAMLMGEVAYGQGQLTLNSSKPTPPCKGDTVTVSLSATGGAPPYNITRMDGVLPYDTVAGELLYLQAPDVPVTYILVDNAGSQVIETITLNSPNEIEASAHGDMVVCPGGLAEITITATGGTHPFNLQTLTFDTTFLGTTGTFYFGVGTHSHTVKDTNDCTDVVTFTITESAGVTMSSSSTDETCNDANGTATATPTSGTPPFTYMWAPGGATTATVTDLAAGTYQATVTDANGCSVSSKVTVGNTCDTVCDNECLKLDAPFCGATLSYVNSEFGVSHECVCAPGVADYRFRVVNAALGIDVVIPSVAAKTGNLGQVGNRRKTSLAFLNPCDMQYNTTYTVYASYADSSGNWTSFDDSCPCDITTPAAPAPRISTQYCGDTVPGIQTPLVVASASRVLGARAYQYCFVDTLAGDTIVVTRSGNYSWVTSFNHASGVSLNTTYCIYVKAEICVGGMWVWSTSGDPCYVTSPATRRYQSESNNAIGEQSNSLTPGTFQSDVKNHETTMNLYPNPGKGTETLLSIENLGKASTVNVTVVDFQGKQVYSKRFNPSNGSFTTPIQFNQRLTPGTYFIYVDAGEKRMNQKLIIR